MTYDIIIIGGGPAGLAAAIYAARYRLKTLLLAKTTGGTITKAHKVCNWPGDQNISGIELMDRWVDHARKLGVEIKLEEVTKIEKHDDLFKVNYNYNGKTIIFAMGTKRRELHIRGEKEFLGKGVSYCATCDAAFYKNMTVGVVGGSDSACSSATMLAKFAKKVIVIYRKNKLRAEPFWVKEIEEDERIEVLHELNVKEIKGDKFMTSVELDNGEELKLDGLFIEIGSEPATELAEKLNIEQDAKHYIKVNEKQETNIKGIYAAGDITTNSNYFKQVLTAASEGSIAINSIYEYLKQGENK